MAHKPAHYCSVFFKDHFWGTTRQTSKTLSYADEVTSANIRTHLSYREVVALLPKQSVTSFHRPESLVVKVKKTQRKSLVLIFG